MDPFGLLAGWLLGVAFGASWAQGPEPFISAFLDPVPFCYLGMLEQRAINNILSLGMLDEGVLIANPDIG